MSPLQSLQRKGFNMAVADTDAAAIAMSPTLVKWILGPIITFMAAVFMGVFGWVWSTDRAVRGLKQSLDDDREAREKWRLEIVGWLRQIEETVAGHASEHARRRGFEDGVNSVRHHHE